MSTVESEEALGYVQETDETSSLKRSSSQTSNSAKSTDKASAVPSSFWLATQKDVEDSILIDAIPSSSEGVSTEISTAAIEQDDAKEEQEVEFESEKQQTLHAALTEALPNIESRSLKRETHLHIPNLTPSTAAYLYQHSNTVSQPLTPLPGASPVGLDWGSNMPSSPKSGSLHSLRLSDVDSPVEEDGMFEDKIRSSLVDSEPPQFIMPSLAMPDRRPITDKGRIMGNLRICVAGAQGSGKTSLIRSIIQQCEDIVHIEASSNVTSPSASTKTLLTAPSTGMNPAIVEILASTKCYPPWWNDLDDSRILRRRKSGDSILERNLCFVDTPGIKFSQDVSKSHVVQYIEQSFRNVETPAGLSDLERLNLVTGKGSPLVDAVVFVFSDSSKLEEEFKFFAELNSLTNAIPVLAKCDLQDDEEVLSRKLELLERVKSLAKPFLFGESAIDLIDIMTEAQNKSNRAKSADESNSDDGPTQETQPEFSPVSATINCPPFAVSSLQGSDPLEMDASLLMSESYSPPLHTSDLPHLLNQLFDPEHMSYLRHSAGRKYLSWRRRQVETKNKERGLIHSRKQSRQLQNQCHISGFSFTSRFRGYATSSAKALMREASLGGYGSLSSPNVVDLSSKPGRHDGITESSSNRKKLLEPLSELQSSSASTVIARRQSQTGARSQVVVGSDALELPRWSRPRKTHGNGREQSQRTKYHHGRPSQRLQRDLCFKSMRAADPLGLVSAWEDWGRALVWGAGGGVLVGVAVVLGRWWIAARNVTNE